MAIPQRLLTEAIDLPVDQREELLRALLDSLDEAGADDGHTPAWDAELARRIRDDDAANGEIVADGPRALRQIRHDILGG